MSSATAEQRSSWWLLFVAVGLAIFAGGWVWHQHLSSFLVHASHAEGTVIALERRTTKNAEHPIFTYQDKEGRSHRVRSQWSSSIFEQGDKVDVAYDPSAPESAVITEIASPSKLPLFVMGYGIFFALGTLWFHWKYVRLQKRSGSDGS